ncbi:MAG: M20 family metallopeptidase [Trueperaceae bacterium]|nr:M20 family metallopeptidase [Trueperaceae bacterium]
MPQLDDVLARLDARLEEERAALLDLSHLIHAHPEVRFEEVQAAAWLTEALEARGFTVERGVGGLPTAFRARLEGRGPGPTIAVLCEYDALPGLGHACGHNVIATMGAGAGFALAPLMNEFDGTLLVLGTPAEEGGGGKVILLEEGVFDGVDAAVMIHPYKSDHPSMGTLASTKWDVAFHGVPAHAAMAPHLGRNALDAVRLAFAGIDALRQQTRDDVRIHAVITDGGAAANIIPETAAMNAVARARDARHLFDELVPRLENVFRGAALMTGTELTITPSSRPYLEIVNNAPLEEAFVRHAARRGRTATPYDMADGTGSTDLGNVSHAVPALHGMLAIDDAALPHTAAFERAAGSARGDATVIDGATVLAGLAAELFLDLDLLARAKAAFAEATGPAR